MFKSLDEIFSKVAGELRSWNGVAIVGAGASIMAGLPISSQLPPLLWQAFNEDDDARRVLTTRLGLSMASAKTLIGDDESAVKAAYEVIVNSPRARSVFQTPLLTMH